MGGLSVLFVDAEGGVASREEVDDLARGCDSGVDVGFGGLCAHFFRCEEYASGEFGFEQGCVVGAYVGDIFNVRTLAERFCKAFFVDDFLSCGVDQDASFWKECDQVESD